MTRRPITPQDLWALRRVGRPAVAPDGTFAVVPVTEFDVPENRGRTRLWRVGRDGSTRPLTSPGTDSTSPAVSPDGSRAAFLRKEKEDDKPQVHVMRLDGGEAVCLTDLPLGAAAPRWARDGRSLVFPVPLLAGHESAEATRTEVAARKERKVQVRVTEDRVYRYWDRWLADGGLHHLFRVEADGSGLVDLTPGWKRPLDLEDPGSAFDIAPDGEIAFHSLATDPPYREIREAVYTLAPGGEPRAIWPEGPPRQVRPRYSPDGSTLAFGFAVDYPAFYADRIRLCLHRRAAGGRTVLTEDWDRSCESWEWLPDGSGLVFAAEDDARRSLFTLPIGVGTPALLARGGWLTDLTPVGGGSVWCLHQSLSEPADMAVVSAGEVSRITAFNEALLADLELGRVGEVRFPGAGGDEVQMFLIYPPGFDPARKWPLVHQIHGGPHGVSGDLWHYRWNAQAFAAPGYVVAMVNFHGSTSWGTDFARCILGAWGDLPTADVEAATDYLLGQGSIDPARMAITGGSYGGYLVAWLIGQTGRYAAAICHAGVTNLLGQWATDVTHGRRYSFGGLPWDGLENIRRWSPTDHSTGMTTPTLVIHGERDYRVVVTQGLELYGILQDKGVESRLVYYPDEAHWILKPQNSLHWYGEFLGWLERHLKKG
jgi:dipeptidyl aminopeptidase/acylaminoacyl peptidase